MKCLRLLCLLAVLCSPGLPGQDDHRVLAGKIETLAKAQADLNMFSGTILVAQDGKVIYAGECLECEDVFVSIRPEDILVAEIGEGSRSSARNRFGGLVTKIGTEGSQFRVEVDCGFPLVSFLTKQAIEDLELESGSEVEVLFKATAVHLIGR